jgi:hypothetical protein
MRRECGSALLAFLVALSVVTVGLTGAMGLMTLSVVLAGRTRAMADARVAAQEKLDGAELRRAAEGGSVAPDAPEGGYTDVVVVGSGRVRPYTGVRAEAGATIVRRQWRLWTQDGVRFGAVSAEVMRADAEAPEAARRAARVVLSGALR